ncbi:MAG: ATP-grasp domain-containing protein [Caldilineales bacterium]|nr:ATP-grasp domain-containing protein [Caldilineales bacterium]MCW5860595.1 ATP-grasp domain-containing protein [Caldilineales bacterium]
MTAEHPTTILCLASYFKGGRFLETCKHLGARVLLLTREKLADEPWPLDSIDERFLMPHLNVGPDLVHGVSYLARDRRLDRIVALDDFDVETAAHLREHLRIPGMGETTVRYFRDKLAMRMQAHEQGIPVPEFVHVLNYDRLREYMERVPPPWVLKPRSEAGSVGIKKLYSSEELWRTLDVLGDKQSYYVLEHFLPGGVYHVDSIISERDVVFSIAHQYARPPMSVMHEGGIFMSRTLPRGETEQQLLEALNREVIQAMGMVRGVTHAEFIRAEADGRFYFLELAARVGGANIDRMVEAAAGINPWAEWARLEVAHARGEDYTLPPIRQDYAGLITCLSRQDWPDLSGYQDPEIVWWLQKLNHAGLLVAAPDPARVSQLLADYGRRFEHDFLAVLPPQETLRTI